MKEMLARWWQTFMSPWQDYMDFKGQVDAERTYQVLIVLPSVRSRLRGSTSPLHSGHSTPLPPPFSSLQLVGFVHGYILQSFEVTFYYWLAASLLAGVLCVPSWPWLWHRDPVVWADDERVEMTLEARAREAAQKREKEKRY
jgi:hypothetical protein